jgi:hemoglobin
MPTIETRADVNLLVNTFYATIRKDELLGPIFNDRIPEAMWPEHLSKLTDFWETNLFGVFRFRGNPSAKHIDVDRHLHFTITEEHFEHWLKLWFATVDSLFEGERAERAKSAARRMATAQFKVVVRSRPSAGASPFV